MANFLITGSRAPVALELARNLATFGHCVFLADSLRFPLGRRSKFVSKSFYITAPRKSLKKYNLELQAILLENKIDILIPTCEEVFYLSAIKKDLEKYATVFCPNFELIKSLHSKYKIFTCAEDTGFLVPHSEVVTLEELKKKDNFEGLVVKKEFCRFGTDVLIEPTNKKITLSHGKRFILQEKIVGTEYCSYAIANKGKVSFVSIYEPKHRVRKTAGIYFEPVVEPTIEQRIINFCEKNKITGQIGFDVIKNEKGVYLLECNPRATSGLHLLSAMNLSKGFISEYKHNAISELTLNPKMITLAMLLIGFPLAMLNCNIHVWKRDFLRAQDVISLKNDKSFFFYSLLSFAEIIFISLREFKSLRAASTHDIEWDGEDLDG
ncbi:MAG: ATP-grasp domain-containing protein [Pseudomonadota bacterium]